MNALDIQEQFLAGFVKEAAQSKISEEQSLSTVRDFFLELEKFSAEVSRMEKEGAENLRAELIEKLAVDNPGIWHNIMNWFKQYFSPGNQGNAGQAWGMGLGGAGLGGILGALAYRNNPLMGFLMGALGGGGLGGAYGAYGNKWFENLNTPVQPPPGASDAPAENDGGAFGAHAPGANTGGAFGAWKPEPKPSLAATNPNQALRNASPPPSAAPVAAPTAASKPTFQVGNIGMTPPRNVMSPAARPSPVQAGNISITPPASLLRRPSPMMLGNGISIQPPR